MSIIKPKRGTGSPAGSIETNEIAMDTASKTLYVSTDGTDAEILANNTEYFLANNIISGLTNETPTYAGIIKTKRANTAQNFVLTGSEIVRDLGSDGAVLGKEPRTASLDFSVQSDATNTNNSPQNIYAGGFYGGSGSNDGTSPNFLACFAYDDGITSFSKPVIWEGTKDSFTIEPLVIANDGADIIKSDSSLTDGVLNLRVDASAYNKAQAVFEDSNGKAMSLAGQFDTVQARDKAIITLDPGNLHSPTNQANYAGDYAVYFNKEYGDIENPKIEQNVFGARDGFILAVRGDNNGNSDPYDFKPMDIFCEQFRVRARTAFNTTEEVLSISDSKSIFNNTLETYNQ